MELNLPERPENALSATEWYEEIKHLPHGHEREEAIIEQSYAGNFPNFMRTTYSVPVEGGGLEGYIFVLPDYWCIGSDKDYIYTPMWPDTAQKIMNHFGMYSLPTRKMVKDIYKAATHMCLQGMAPPKYPYDNMLETSRWPIHTDWIKQQMKHKDIEPGRFVEGAKKNVILSTNVENNEINHVLKVGVFGGYNGAGQPIHNFSYHSHIRHYADYSHGIRFVLMGLSIGEDEVSNVRDTLRGDNYKLLSDEGRFKEAKYPCLK
jgi:hypothetical protein